MFVEIIDTTLRDGEQTNGVAFTDKEKLSIAKHLLTEVKVNRIEIASARVSKGEFECASKIIQWAKESDFLDKIEILGFLDKHISIDWVNNAENTSTCCAKVLCVSSKDSCEKLPTSILPT